METHRSIARLGGWNVLPVVTDRLLQDPYRHHVVVGSAGAEVYVLPPAKVGAGVGLPVGSIVWVHNLSGTGHAVTIRNQDSSFSIGLLAQNSAAFALHGRTGAIGIWRRVATGPTGAGSPTPSGYELRIDVRNSRNNLHLLSEAVLDGYDGTVAALVRCYVAAGIVIGSESRLIPALDIGGDVPVSGINWHASSLVYLEIGAGSYVSGAGGNGGTGGIGGLGGASGAAGQDGGTGLRAPISVLINSMGTIQGGGGGGGGGDGLTSTLGLNGGGGGGGAGANVAANLFVSGGSGASAGSYGQTGSDGTLTTQGYGGIGSTVGANVGGTAGNGGTPGTAGQPGQLLNNAGPNAFGTGGAAGASISRDGSATVTFLPNAGGTVTGPQVVA